MSDSQLQLIRKSPNLALFKDESPETDAAVKWLLDVPAIPVTQLAEGQTCSFLRSLGRFLPRRVLRHKESKKYLECFKLHRNELIAILFNILNRTVFDQRLDNLSILWGKRMRQKAYMARIGMTADGVRTVTICLSAILINRPDLLRDAFMHALCHAAVWQLDGANGRSHHGLAWHQWCQRALHAHPDLNPISMDHKLDLTRAEIKLAVTAFKAAEQLSVVQRNPGLVQEELLKIVLSYAPAMDPTL